MLFFLIWSLVSTFDVSEECTTGGNKLVRPTVAEINAFKTAIEIRVSFHREIFEYI